jgi:hypothetical protein
MKRHGLTVAGPDKKLNDSEYCDHLLTYGLVLSALSSQFKEVVTEL